MKKILFALVAGYIPALAVTTGAYAQDANNIAALEPPKHVINMDKAIPSEKENTAKLNEISLTAMKDFAKSYKMADNEKWYKVPDGFRVKFIANGIISTIYYYKNGSWAGSLKGYHEDKMDRNVRAIVKSKYFDFKITYVQEIETRDTQGIPTYIVHIEDAGNFKLVRVSGGEMDVYEQYKKA